MDNTNLFFLIFNLNGHFGILDKLMIFGATYLIYLVILFIFILVLKGKTPEKKAFLLILLGLPVAFLLIQIIHIFFYEPRPFVAFHFPPIVPEKIDASFPSRHATISAIIAFSYVLFKSKWSPIFLFLMLWIGISRIYVGVHYPLDILGGFITGSISLVIAKQIFKLIKTSFLS